MESGSACSPACACAAAPVSQGWLQGGHSGSEPGSGSGSTGAPGAVSLQLWSLPLSLFQAFFLTAFVFFFLVPGIQYFWILISVHLNVYFVYFSLTYLQSPGVHVMLIPLYATQPICSLQCLIILFELTSFPCSLFSPLILWLTPIWRVRQRGRV